MQLVIMKFGGNTINDAEKLSTAYSTVSSVTEKGSKVVAVLSAIRGVTDTLKGTLEKIEDDNFDECFSQFEKQLRELHQHSRLSLTDVESLKEQFLHFVKSGKKSWLADSILVKGEEIFCRDFAENLKEQGVQTKLINFYDPEFPTIVLGYFGNARCDLEKTKVMCEKIVRHLTQYDCICLPGYGGVDGESGRVKTLRRGGSDAVAAALSYGFFADALWILTDVNGIKRAVTNRIMDAPTIGNICVEELRDAGVYGAKVPNEVATRPLMLYCPPETFIAKYDEINGEKSRVVKDRELDDNHPIELVAQREIIIYEFNGINLHEEVAKLELELNEKLIDFISLGGGEYTRNLMVPTDQEVFVDNAINSYRNRIAISKSKGSLVGIVGKGMATTPGIIGRLGGALARKGINIHYQFDISPISCGVIVDRLEAEYAVELLYDEFALHSF